MNILVSIVYHSGLDELMETLSCVRATGIEITVVVLDVSPQFDTRRLADDCGAIIIRDPRNGGFAWGHHRVFDAYGRDSEYFVCLNPDLYFMTGSLEALTRHLADTPNGIFYALQFSALGETASFSVHHQLSVRDALSRWVGLGRASSAIGTSEVIKSARERRTRVEIPKGMSGSGAMIAMKSSLWRDTGGLDTDFFLFGEDREFGHRCSRLGIPSFLCGDVPVFHAGGFRTLGISARASTEYLVSEQLYWRKAFGSRSIPFILAIQTLGILIRLMHGLVSADARTARVWSTSLRYRVMHLCEKAAAPRASDGFRLPVKVAKKEAQ